MYDLIIVGAGPIGMTVAIEAKKKDLSCLLIEKGALVNTVFHFPTNVTFFSTSKLLEIGDVPFISHGDKPNRREALEYFRRVNEKWKLNIRYYELVKSVKKENDVFTIETDRSYYTSNHVVISTGFYDLPHKMNVPGEELPKVRHYFDEPHPYVGQRVAVIGAANSACDVALELFHKGADVTMIIREDQIGDRVKYWIRPNIENRIKEGAIKTFFNAEVKKIEEETITFIQEGKEIKLDNDFVLAMTGFEPDYKFLENIGIDFFDDEYRSPKYDEMTHETNVPGMYMAGVVCGGLKTNKFFIENAKDHAEKITEDILKKGTKR